MIQISIYILIILLYNGRYYKTNKQLSAFINKDEIYDNYFKDTELEVYGGGSLSGLNVRHHMFPNNLADLEYIIPMLVVIYYMDLLHLE